MPGPKIRSASLITPGISVTAGDGVCIACEVPGYINLILDGGSILRIYATQGTVVIDNIAVTGVQASGTTATASVSPVRLS